MKTPITILLIALATLMIQAQNSTTNELITTLDKNTPAALQKHHVPGLSIAVLKDGKMIVKKSYGYADVANSRKVNTTTGFNIGSISKMFTAWGIMKLVEDGKIKLDAPASQYINGWKLPASSFNEKEVTIRNLLQHTAGLNVHGYSGFEDKSKLTSLEQSLSGSNNKDERVELMMDPGSKWQYSGGGYSLLQLVIEQVSGASFADYMKATIFTPLKMNHSSFTIDNTILKRSAKGYDEDGKEIPLRYFNAQAAAGLHTTIDDLILFAEASFAKNPVLSQESIRLLITPTELSKGNYGMGYMIMNRFGNFTLSGHGGSNQGWQSGFMLDFESKSGIIVLTNGSSGKNVLFGNMKDWAQWHAKQ